MALLNVEMLYAGPKPAGKSRVLGVPELLEIVAKPKGKEGLHRSISSLGSGTNLFFARSLSAIG